MKRSQLTNKDQPETSTLDDIIDLDSYNTERPLEGKEHINNPNVVMIHHHNGLEVSGSNPRLDPAFVYTSANRS